MFDGTRRYLTIATCLAATALFIMYYIVEVDRSEITSTLCGLLDKPRQWVARQPVMVNRTQGDWGERGFRTVPHTLLPLITNDRFCQEYDTPVSLVIYVISAANNSIPRQRIRQTWGNAKYSFNKRIKILFILGKHESDIVNRLVYEEFNTYRDIVQFGVSDGYDNLTNRGIETLRWIKDHCSQVPYFMKTDDDIIINIWAVRAELQKIQPFGIDFDRDLLHIACVNVESGEQISRCGKNPVSVSEYPGLIKPDYCEGSTYVLPYPVIVRLYMAAGSARYLSIEDTFVTGVLPLIDGNIQLRNIPGYGRIKNWRLLRIHNLLHARKELKKYMIVHANREGVFMDTWQMYTHLYE